MKISGALKHLIGMTLVATGVALSTAAMADTIKVGVLGSFSGPYAPWGVQFRNALDLYQEQHQGKASGHDVELVYRDVGGNEPARAKQLAQELVVRDGVQYIIGLEFTPTILAVADIATEAEVPTINLNSGTSSVTRASEFLTRTGFTQWQVAAPAGEYAFDQGKKTAVIVSADYAPGKDALDSFRYGFEKKGGKILQEIKVPLGTTDFSTYLLRLQEAKPDVALVFMPVGPMSVGFLKAYVDRGLLKAGIDVYVGAEAQETDLPALGDAAVGIHSVFTYSPYQDNPENKAFVEALTKKYGAKGLPNLATVAAYDGLALVYHMIGATKGQKDGKAAMESIKGLTIQSPRGPITIDAKTRDIIQNVYLRVVEKRGDGMLVNKTLATQQAVKDPWKELNPAK